MAPFVPQGESSGSLKQAKKKEITVLVTGFAPFQDKFPVNPSFEIAKSLPDSLDPSSDDAPLIRIIGYANPVNVVYKDVYELVPHLYDSYSDSVDLILHIGMAAGMKYYKVEKFAHRDGYTKNKDLNGKFPYDEDEETPFTDCPSIMTTSLEYQRTLLKWQQRLIAEGIDAEARPSSDAGHYLCDYIYFNSLAYFGRKSGEMEDGCKSARPVLFLHVPAESDKEILDRGRKVATALVRAMVESFCATDDEAQ